jgi:excisionase family DNA binding protein
MLDVLKDIDGSFSKMSQALALPEVFTLDEAAEYLRLSPETVQRQAQQGNIPGQLIEGSWRFLHAALEDWLRHQDNRAILLQQFGALSEDEYLDELRASIYQARGRSEADIDNSL